MPDRYLDIIASEKAALKARLAQIRRRHKRELFVLFAIYGLIMLCVILFLPPL